MRKRLALGIAAIVALSFLVNVDRQPPEADGNSKASALRSPAVHQLSQGNAKSNAFVALEKSLVPFGKEFWRAAAGKPDMKDAVERVTHAFRDRSVQTPRYAAELTETGFVFRPHQDVEAQFDLGAEGWQVVGNTAQSVGHDGLVRHLESRQSGVFLTWIIPERPDSPDLELDAELRGLVYAGQSDHGHHFADSSGVARCRIGNATAVDSVGSKWPLQVIQTAGTLAVKVPLQILANAVYPLAIDPEITAEEGIDVIEPLPVNPNVQAPNIASNGELFFTVWEERNNTNGVFEIRGTRVTRDGAIADPNGIKISWPRASSHSYAPGIGSDGTNFLVAWIESGSSNGISAAILGPNGALISRGKLNSSFQQFPVHAPAVASDGNSYLVAFHASRVSARIISNNTINTSHPVIQLSTDIGFGGIAAVWNGASYTVGWQNDAAYVRRIRSDGALVDAAPQRVGAVTSNLTNLALGWSGQNYLMIWQRWYALLDADANVLQTGEAPAHGPVWTAHWDGDVFWTIWQTQAGANVNRFSPSGGWLDGAIGPRILRPGGSGISLDPVRLAQIGDAMVVVYAEYIFRGAWAKSVSNPPVDVGDEVDSGMRLSAPAFDHAPAAAPLGDGHIVVWSGAQSPTSNNADILGARLAGDGSLVDPQGFVIAAAIRDQLNPAVASLGNEAFVVWEDRRTGNTDIIGSRVIADGSVLDTNGIVLSADSSHELSPDIAAAKGNYFIVWDKQLMPNQYQVNGKPYFPGLVTPSASVSITTAQSRPIGFLPKVASDGTDFLVVWHSPYAGRGSTIVNEGGSLETPSTLPYAQVYASRVDQNGNPLDGPGFPIAKASADQMHPVVAYGAGNYLAAWMQITNPVTLTIELWSAPINSAGQPGPAQRFAVGESNRWDLEIAGTSAGFFASWRDRQNDSIPTTDIKGAYLRADGSLSDEGVFLVNSGQFTWNPALSAQPTGEMLIASEASRPGAFRAVWNRTAAFEPPLTDVDTATAGNWKDVYSGSGYMIAGDATSLPGDVQGAVENALMWVWTKDAWSPALQRASGAGYVAACWYAANSFDLRLNLGEKQRRVALYFLDWGMSERAQRVDVLDNATGGVLHSTSIDRFRNGKYLVYSVNGDVRFRFTRTGKYNAVLSGVFLINEKVAAPVINPTSRGFTGTMSVTMNVATPGATIHYTTDGSEPTALSSVYNGPISVAKTTTVKAMAAKAGFENSAIAVETFTRTDAPDAPVRFIGRDATTRGDWMNAQYGREGYIVFGDSQWFAPGVSAKMTAGNVWVWNQATTDNSALHRASALTRLAACAYASESIELQFDWAAGETRQIAIYCLDWSLHGRSQTIEVIQNGAIYPAQTVSAFGEGEYLIWEVTGPCKVRVNRTGGPNAVISGVFLDAKGGVGGLPASFVGLDADTKGSWKGVYGSSGYSIAADGDAAAAGVTITPQGAGNHIWAYGVADVEALQMANADGRIASCWYGATFDVAVTVTEGAARNVGMYFLDWDAAGRAVRVDVINANTGATMDRRIVTAFVDGIWARWSLSGGVVFRITSVGGPNAVVSGVFVD